MDEFPMHEEGDLERVKLLIERGESANSRDDEGRTPLHWAAEKGRYEVVDFFSSLPECDLNIMDHKGRTPVVLAARREKNSVEDLLLQRGALRWSAGHCKWTPLHYAALNGRTDQVRRLLDRGEADVNAATSCGDTPLMFAARWGHEDASEVLIRAGADVNRSNAEKRTALHHAACYEASAEVVRVLLKKEELDLNPQDENGRTPLHCACYWDCRDVMKQLLAAGADTTLKNYAGETALTYSIVLRLGPLEVIRLFVQEGAFLEDSDCVCIYRDPFIKESVLEDAFICTRSIVNKFHRQSLPALNSISYVARKLPNIDKFRLNARQIDEVENLVRWEIERNTFCHVFKAHPMALSALCVLSLITCQSGMKRSAYPDFGEGHAPLKKFHRN